MQRCPCCNARLRGAVVCPRCQADLRAGIAAGQAAGYWLGRAIEFWQMSNHEAGLHALQRSLWLKKTHPALKFRDFLITWCCRKVLALLLQNDLHAAKQLLYECRSLFPLSAQLRQLQAFSDFLLVKHASTKDMPYKHLQLWPSWFTRHTAELKYSLTWLHRQAESIFKDK